MRALPISAPKRCRSAKPCPASSVASAMVLARIQCKIAFMISAWGHHVAPTGSPLLPELGLSEVNRHGEDGVVAKFSGHFLFLKEHSASGSLWQLLTSRLPDLPQMVGPSATASAAAPLGSPYRIAPRAQDQRRGAPRGGADTSVLRHAPIATHIDLARHELDDWSAARRRGRPTSLL